MIIPQEEETLIEIYYCPNCKGTYSRNTDVQCAIQHDHGECCHATDSVISKEELIVIEALLRDKTQCNIHQIRE